MCGILCRACQFGVRKIFPACRKPLPSIVSQFFSLLVSHFLRDFSRSIFFFSFFFLFIPRAYLRKFLPSYILSSILSSSPAFLVETILTRSVKKKSNSEMISNFCNSVYTRIEKMIFYSTNTLILFLNNHRKKNTRRRIFFLPEAHPNKEEEILPNAFHD